ncbi:serine hydrolase [Streptosporangium sp. NPDC000396]|uniref:serine hydrolase n=1 Tax=Streptosporangium sp. NPDC000396 TaxID=3366185 RepID=UPI00369BCB54
MKLVCRAAVAAAVLAPVVTCGHAAEGETGETVTGIVSAAERAATAAGAAGRAVAIPEDLGDPEPPTVPAPRASSSPALSVVRETPRPPAPPKVSAPELTRVLDRFLARHGGRASAMVQDLATDRVYRYHHGLQLPTASTSKVDILMALLLRTRWRELSEQDKHDANRMIRFSDNAAADRLYERIGLESGLARANRKFDLEHTYTPAGRCLNLYCWGITQTTAEDQVRLIRVLAGDESLLAEKDRERVLRLMEDVTPRQKWGISAAACEGGQVSLKNGWLRHVANRRWAVVSAGLIREPGHDYAVVILTEDSPSMRTGVTKVEGMAKRILNAFRGERRCAANDRYADLSISR